MELMLAIQHWQHHAHLQVYRFLQISIVIEMCEITILRELFVMEKKSDDRGKDLFMYFMEILI